MRKQRCRPDEKLIWNIIQIKSYPYQQFPMYLLKVLDFGSPTHSASEVTASKARNTGK